MLLTAREVSFDAAESTCEDGSGTVIDAGRRGSRAPYRRIDMIARLSVYTALRIACGAPARAHDFEKHVTNQHDAWEFELHAARGTEYTSLRILRPSV